MIFTRRFGALAARPVFADVTETDQEQVPALPFAEDEAVHAEESAARLVGRTQSAWSGASKELRQRHP